MKLAILSLILVATAGLVTLARYSANAPKTTDINQTTTNTSAPPTATIPSPSSLSTSTPKPTPLATPIVEPSSASSEIVITEKDNGKVFYANRSDRVTLKLTKGARTWSNLNYDHSLIEFAELAFFAPTDYQQWEGRIKKTGQSTIQIVANPQAGRMISTLLLKVTLVVQ